MTNFPTIFLSPLEKSVVKKAVVPNQKKKKNYVELRKTLIIFKSAKFSQFFKKWIS